MHLRSGGLILSLCLVSVGCTSHAGHDQDLPDTGMPPSQLSEALPALEREVGQVAQERVWSGQYFRASMIEGAVVDRDEVFVWVFNGQTRLREVHCLEAATGARRWFTSVGAGPLEYPVSAGERFVTCLVDQGRSLVLLKRSNGALIHAPKVAIDPLPTAAPASSESTIFVASMPDDRLHAVNPETGMSGWAFGAEGTPVGQPIATPRLPRRLVIVGTDAGEVFALPPKGWDENAPEAPAWRRQLLGDVSGQLSVAERMTDGRPEVSVLAPCEDRGLYCLDAASGESRWTHRTAHPFVGKPEAAKGRVFARNTERLWVLDLATGRPAWQPSEDPNNLRFFERCQGVLASNGERAYLWVDGKRIARIEGRTGDVVTSASLPSFDFIVPSGENDLLIAMTRDGHIVAFR